MFKIHLKEALKNHLKKNNRLQKDMIAEGPT